MMNLTKLIFLGLLSTTLAGCGPDQKSAFRTISNYAGHGETAPTVDDFDNAGIKGVSVRNIKMINSYINNSAYANLDTEEELRTNLGALGRVIGVSFMGADQAGAPTKKDYSALGINVEKASDEEMINVNKMLSFTKKRDFPSLKKAVEDMSKFFSHAKKRK